MTKHRVLLTILSFLFLCSPQQPAIASELQGKVVEVVDGETVVVSSANHLIRVHLYTVSAPRKEHPLAVVIRQHLADFVLGKLVSIRYSIMESDLINGLVFLNGNDIGLQMVRDGAASYNSKYERELSDSTRQLYIESERAARNEKLGIWRTGLSMSSPQTQAQAEENANTQELTRTSPNAVGPKEPSKYRSSQEPANSLKNDDTALSPISSTSKPQIYTSGADAGTTSEGPSSVSTYAEKASASPFQAQLIPRNSKVYIAPFKAEDPDDPQAQGFESYIAAAFGKKSVPLLIVANPSQADFIIEGSADRKGAGWAKKIFLKDFRRSTSAAMTVTNLRTGVVAYADSSDRSSANRGLRSSAEKLAKYLKKKIEDDERKR